MRDIREERVLAGRRREARVIQQRDRTFSSPSPKNKRIREESVCKWGVSGVRNHSVRSEDCAPLAVRHAQRHVRTPPTESRLASGSSHLALCDRR